MKKLSLIVLLALVLVSEVFATVTPPSTQGSEFYFSFMRARNSRQKTMTLTISSEQAGIAKFTSSVGVVSTQPINVGITNITLASITSDASSLENDVNGHLTTVVSGTYSDCYTIAENSVQQKGYMVETFLPDGITPLKVSLYAGLSGAKTVDVANIYPIEALGNDYYVVSRSGNNAGLGDFPSEALIVATEDNTVVEILPTCLLNGQAATDPILSLITITLNRGETYQLRAESADILAIGRTDLTGTQIRVKDDGSMYGNKCKKIAVFAGSQHGCGLNAPYNNGDYEFDQLFPTHLWGNNYVFGATCSYGTDVVRIVASQPCTDVLINGTLVATLNQTEFYEYRDNASAGGFITTSKPVECVLFTTGQIGGSGVDGGPSMITLAPMEQYLNNIQFSVPSNPNIFAHSVLITSLTSLCEQTYFNGVQMNLGNGYTWTPIPGTPQYSTIIVDLLANMQYAITNNANPSKGGFNAYVFASSGTDAGYGFSVGSSLGFAKPKFYLNDDPSINSNQSNCIQKDVKFTISAASEYSAVVWDFGDGSPKQTIYSPSNSVSHNYNSNGSFTVQMLVLKTNSTCYGSIGLQDTVTAIVEISTPVVASSSITLSKGSSLSSTRSADPIFGGATPKYYWNTGATTESIILTDDYGTSNTYWVKTYDTNCHLITDTIHVTISPDTEVELIQNEQVNVFPNPVGDSFQVGGFTGKALLTFMDVHGKVLFSKEVEANELISVSNIAQGLYLVKVLTQKGESVQKIVKE